MIVKRRKTKGVFKKDPEFPDDEDEYRLSNCELYALLSPVVVLRHC